MKGNLIDLDAFELPQYIPIEDFYPFTNRLHHDMLACCLTIAIRAVALLPLFGNAEPNDRLQRHRSDGFHNNITHVNMVYFVNWYGKSSKGGFGKFQMAMAGLIKREWRLIAHLPQGHLRAKLPTAGSTGL